MAEQTNKKDGGESSHWTLYHANYQFHEKVGFSGLRGFGGRKKRNILSVIMHRLLQSRFRWGKTDFTHLNEIENLANQITIKQNRNYDLDVFRQSLTLAYLNKYRGRHLTFNMLESANVHKAL